jgi:hypothetical protein
LLTAVNRRSKPTVEFSWERRCEVLQIGLTENRRVV